MVIFLHNYVNFDQNISPLEHTWDVHKPFPSSIEGEHNLLRFWEPNWFCLLWVTMGSQRASVTKGQNNVGLSKLAPWNPSSSSYWGFLTHTCTVCPTPRSNHPKEKDRASLRGLLISLWLKSPGVRSLPAQCHRSLLCLWSLDFLTLNSKYLIHGTSKNYPLALNQTPPLSDRCRYAGPLTHFGIPLKTWMSHRT